VVPSIQCSAPDSFRTTSLVRSRSGLVFKLRMLHSTFAIRRTTYASESMPGRMKRHTSSDFQDQTPHTMLAAVIVLILLTALVASDSVTHRDDDQAR
jgi:hypothetical protein